MRDASDVTTFLFTDIEGSTALWEQQPERMRDALACHDSLARTAVEAHGGVLVKMTGDGIHAAFADALDAVLAAIALQRSLADPAVTAGVALRVRCGVHRGPCEYREHDFYGSEVNRAARIMGAAHGGQVVTSEAVARALVGRLPHDVALRDLGRVRLPGLGAPERMSQVVHPALRSEFPPLRSLEETPTNLPHPITSFVGRERELARARDLLCANRLVTLAGMGGIGKSRLALQLAAAVRDEHAHGLWLVELAAVTDPRLVAQAVASVLGVVGEAGRPVEEALVRFVRGRELLLVLDNCEHLREACARLARQLLESGAGLKILTTSREPLGIAGETVYKLPALAVPGPREAVDPASASRVESVRLFIERAKAAQADFPVTGENVTAVAAICHRLDGIPLAIELAAARVRSLSVQQIAIRLNDRFRLLAGADRTAMPRQRTLRALIDWSYELLTPAERALFARLSAFAGGWTLEAAEDVCADAVAEPDTVLEVLGRLVEKSLVAMERHGERYAMLETVRQYSAERLREIGAAESAAERHFRYFLQLAEHARPGLVGPDQAAWLAKLDAERENLLAALAWSTMSRRTAEPALRLAGALKIYWINRGLLALGHQVAEAVLALTDPGEGTTSRCRALYDSGHLCWYMGRYEHARSRLEESLAIARALGDGRPIGAVLQALGMAALGQGDLDAAARYLEEARERARETGTPRQQAAAAIELGQLHRVRGQHAMARSLYESGLAIATDMGDRETVAVALLNLAMVAVVEGERQAARQMVLHSMQIAEEIRSVRMMQSVLEVCAGLAASEGQWERAARFYGAAEAQSGETGLRREPADEAFLAPLLQRARDALGEGYAPAESAGRSLTVLQATIDARAWLAQAPMLAVPAA